MNDWLDGGLKGRDEKGTIGKNRSMANKHLIPFIGKAKLKELSADDVDDWMDGRAEFLATRSLRDLLAVLRRSIAHVQRRDKAVRNVAADLVRSYRRLGDGERREGLFGGGAVAGVLGPGAGENCTTASPTCGWGLYRGGGASGCGDRTVLRTFSRASLNADSRPCNDCCSSPLAVSDRIALPCVRVHVSLNVAAALSSRSNADRTASSCSAS